MSNKTNINMVEVKIGDTENHLLFVGYVARFSNNKRYYFDYIGTEVICGDLPDTVTLQLKNQFNKVFGYPPFDINSIKNIFEEVNSFEISLSKF